MLRPGLKGLLTGALASISVFAFTMASPAYQAVTVNGIEATRILIAPPQTDLGHTIRDGLRAAMAGASTGSRADTDASRLYYFYGARHFEPLWLDESGTDIVFSDAAENLIALFENAHLQGLDPADYAITTDMISAAAGDPEALAALEAQFSAAVLRYASDARGGRLNPRQVSDFIDVDTRPVDEVALFAAIAEARDPAAVLMGYHPTHPQFIALRDLLAKHYSGAIEDIPPIPDGGLIRPGMADPRVAALRDRLGVTLPVEANPAIYDAELAAAVAEFQTTMGLAPDSVVGPATVAALNGANGATEALIIANMERWRWMPDDLGDFNVLVNIPEYRLDVMRDGRSVWNTRIIVGTAVNQTPIFSDMIRHVVTNPYWNVPSSILRNEVFPRVAANPNYIASQNMELLYGGKAIDPWMVDWSQATPSMFRVRQKPGNSNAMGQVKFLFPNSHDVYLHDTNARYLFERSMRALSHGCVRVQDPFGFAQALLEFEPGFTVASLENTLGSSERWFNMDRQVPVHLTYFTLRIEPDGTIRSFADLYGHDARIIDMLGLE